MSEPIDEAGAVAGEQAPEGGESTLTAEEYLAEHGYPVGQPEEWAPSQEEWQNVVSTLAQLTEALSPDPGPAVAEPDVSQVVATAVDATIAGVAPELQALRQERGEQFVRDRFAELQQTVGPFDLDRAHALADILFMAGPAKDDPETAILTAAHAAHAEHAAQAQRIVGERLAAEARSGGGEIVDRERALELAQTYYDEAVRAGKSHEVAGELAIEHAARAASTTPRTYQDVVLRFEDTYEAARPSAKRDI